VSASQHRKHRGSAKAKAKPNPSSKGDPKIQGPVNLEVHYSGSLGDRGLLFLSRCLVFSGAFQLDRLSPTLSGSGATMELYLRQPFNLTRFLRMLPGIMTVKEEPSNISNGILTIKVTLEESQFPEDGKPDSKALRKAMLAAR